MAYMWKLERKEREGQKMFLVCLVMEINEIYSFNFWVHAKLFDFYFSIFPPLQLNDSYTNTHVDDNVENSVVHNSGFTLNISSRS